MRERIVSFEVAKLAKEKGFNLILEHDGHVYDEDIQSIVDWIKSNQKDNWNNPRYVRSCSAPTQALLQKWLREKHNIKIIVDSCTKNQFGEWVQWYCRVDNKETIDHRDGLESYEDALEIALKEGLKLITHENNT